MRIQQREIRCRKLNTFVRDSDKKCSMEVTTLDHAPRILQHIGTGNIRPCGRINVP
jgi:hypothetical protein